MSNTKLDVKLEPLLESDLPAAAEGCFQAFPSFYLPMEPEDLRPPHDIRVQRFASRLQHLLISPHTHCTKATLDGKLVGITIWHKPGAPVFNLKRRLPLEGREVTEEEEESWKGVDQGKWEEVWGGWDKVREELMKGQPHWYIAPLWVLPEYQGRGIGGKLLQEVVDLADQHTPSQPIYLEASQMGALMYEAKFNFKKIGTSEYVEMARFGPRKE
ncbi:acyl-CoA N-acyltransferase [Leucosporidium creatinivorum]|uniref:Acyl-CoA N-acyltransferase n=1 Tax=Leucosporidium creatinivorum TaxID=106004 RepID=A0A1Y2C0T0_9BASI|nr:acyl-CoA N-acyltransferase [Leucosporidium creatinivorum]